MSKLTAGRKRALVVQDDAGASETLARSLAGYEVEIVTNGTMAFDRGRHHDLVLVDLNLPFVAGEAVIALFARRRPGVPLIAMSGLKCGRRDRQAVTAGAWLLVRKPLEEEEVCRAVELVEARRSLDGLGPLLASAPEFVTIREASC